MLDISLKFVDCTAGVVSLAGAVASVVTSAISLGFRLVSLIGACGALLINLAVRAFTLARAFLFDHNAAPNRKIEVPNQVVPQPLSSPRVPTTPTRGEVEEDHKHRESLSAVKLKRSSSQPLLGSQEPPSNFLDGIHRGEGEAKVSCDRLGIPKPEFAGSRGPEQEVLNIRRRVMRRSGSWSFSPTKSPIPGEKVKKD